MTRLENLSNELFFEIFDYLHALDIFMGFSSLNERISMILSSIPLRVVVSSYHCYRQLEILSSYLTDHAHQVISLSLQNYVRDFSSVISFFFTRHTFENLELCAFYSDHSSLRLQNVIQQLQNLNKLRSFRLIAAPCIEFCETERQYLSQTILTHKSSLLRSIDLSYYFNHSHITNAVTCNWILTSLTLTFYKLPGNLSIYCILSVLHTYRALRRLHLYISTFTRSDVEQSYVQNCSTVYQDYVPVLSSLEFFDLQIKAMCSSEHISNYINDLLDGHQWQRILTNHVPYLKKFDFLIILLNRRALLNLDYIVNSFQYFVVHYDDWHMIVKRSRFYVERPGEYVSLRTLTYSINQREYDFVESGIVLATLDVRSTLTTDAQYQMFHKHNKELKVIAPTNMSITGNVPSCPLFQNVQHLIMIFQERKEIVFHSLWDLLLIPEEENEVTDPIKCVNILNRYMDMSVVKQLDIEPKNSICQDMYIDTILL
ncbi:unnamed protein product [Rotaria sordida]|uniref:F-box domain-containing protein n=3 Tax=Rotaria sordida TaxID=392033 RepID=A0A819DIQ7_9BILA|nr:unnamed protein product [Rotaria sordida]